MVAPNSSMNGSGEEETRIGDERNAEASLVKIGTMGWETGVKSCRRLSIGVLRSRG